MCVLEGRRAGLSLPRPRGRGRGLTPSASTFALLRDANPQPPVMAYVEDFPVGFGPRQRREHPTHTRCRSQPRQGLNAANLLLPPAPFLVRSSRA